MQEFDYPPTSLNSVDNNTGMENVGVPELVYSKGTMDIAIGTDIAITEQYLSDKKVKNNLFINIRTLIRNIYQAADHNLVTVDNLYAALVNEVYAITGTVSNSKQGDVKVTLYVSTYASVLKKLPVEVIKVATTDLQLKYINIETGVLQRLSENKNAFKHVIYDTTINGEHVSAYILTHISLDLLSVKKFNVLALLESHTGNVKGRNDWYLKLTGGKKLTNIPFNLATLCTFGDGAYISGLGIKSKRTIVDLANKYNWTTITTKDKVVYSLETLSDKALSRSLLTILRTNLS